MLKLKRRQLKLGRRKKPTQQKQKVGATEKEAPKTIQFNLEDLRAKSEDDVESIAVKLFSQQEFYAEWKKHSEALFPQVQTLITSIYAFQDVAAAMESTIAETIDPGVAIWDDDLNSEITEIIRFRLILLFVNYTFNEADAQAMRDYILQPSLAGNKPAAGTSPGDLIRQMYEQAFGKKPPSPQQSTEQPNSVGVTVSRGGKTKSRPPVNE